MSLYFRRYHEQLDLPETLYSPPPTFEEKYLFTKCIEEFYTFTFSHLADAFIQSDLQLGST